MTPAPENPPAFPNAPCPAYTDDAQYGQRGMSLRDYFAGQALVGLMANQTMLEGINARAGDADTANILLAAICYSQADAMLAARTQPKPSP